MPVIEQSEYQCGPASMAMALAWSGLPIDADSLVESVYAPGRKGSLQSSMVAAARRHGRVAYEIGSEEELLRELAAGNPVIVLLNLGTAWWPVWHYSVVVGYEDEGRVLFVHSGERERRLAPWWRFAGAWRRAKRWGLLVLPANSLPATAGEPGYLRAAAGLESTGHDRAAAEAYRAALVRWPNSLGARIALANVAMARGSDGEAVRWLTEAVRLHPGSAVAHNNLAHVLASRGERDAARRAAEEAVRLDPSVDLYRETLRDIE